MRVQSKVLPGPPAPQPVHPPSEGSCPVDLSLVQTHQAQACLGLWHLPPAACSLFPPLFPLFSLYANPSPSKRPSCPTLSETVPSVTLLPIVPHSSCHHQTQGGVRVYCCLPAHTLEGKLQEDRGGVPQGLKGHPAYTHVAKVVTRILWTYTAVMEMQAGQERAGGVNPWFCTVCQQNLGWPLSPGGEATVEMDHRGLPGPQTPFSGTHRGQRVKVRISVNMNCASCRQRGPCAKELAYPTARG